MSWVPPRRIVSEPWTVTVQAESTGDVWNTLMGQYVADSSGWSANPDTPLYAGFKHFECDPANRGTGRHLSDTTINEYNGVLEQDYSTDGYSPAMGSLPPDKWERFHTAINWSGQGTYDPVRKRVQWMTKGTGSGRGEWRYNMLPIYRLGNNEQEGWKVFRGFRATTPPDVDNDNACPLTHFFFNNAIDVAGRKLYKKQFQTLWTDGTSIGPSGPFHVFDLDTEQFVSSILAPSWDAWGAGAGPGQFIPNRGSRGTYWYSNMGPRIAEYDPATGTGARADWITIAATGCMPLMHSNYNMYDSIGIMSYNPRALGGEGAVLICGGTRGSAGALTERYTAYYMVSTPSTGTWSPGNTGAIKIYEHSGAELPATIGFGGGNYGQEHICPDPVGDGWLLFPSATQLVPPVPLEDRVVWKLAGTPGSTWQRTTHTIPPIGDDYGVPAPPGGGPLTPIDELGVVWYVCQRPSNPATTQRAWLYKPTPAQTDTALSLAAAAVPSNTFVQFHGNDLNKKTIHPLAGISANIGSSATVPDIDVTEDGANSVNTCVDWGSHGVYDPVGRRAMWACQGQGGNGAAGMYARNTHSIYSETDSAYGANQGRWFANRAFIAPGGNDLGLGHQYGGNAIDHVGRRFYRTSFNENRVWVCDLDTLEWIDSFTNAPQVNYATNGALEFIPTRGTVGALWLWGSNFGHHIWEKVLPNGSWVQIVSSVSTSPDEGCPMAYNPRSNKVLCGTENQAAYIIDCATLAVTPTSTPTFTNNFMYPANGHLCRDPAGTGWVYIGATDKHVYKCDVNGVWTDAGPSPIPANTFIGIPIDEYGVIWYIGSTYYFGNEVSVVNPQAWLYRP